MQHAAATSCNDDGEKKITKKRHGPRTAPAPAASTGWPSVEAVAMAGAVDDGWPSPWVPGVCAGAGDDDDDGTAPVPEHLRAFEAFLEEVVPAEMVVAYRREEEARVRRGGGRRSNEEDVKEKLKLWAKAVVSKTMQRVNHRS